MICLSVKLRNGRFIEGLTANGHAGMMSHSGDPVCAAVSALIGTMILYLKSRPEWQSDIKIPERGCVFLTVGEIPENDRKSWENVCEFFLLGIRSIADEYPKALDLRYL